MGRMALFEREQHSCDCQDRTLNWCRECGERERDRAKER
jgi:hypothetical protein